MNMDATEREAYQSRQSSAEVKHNLIIPHVTHACQGVQKDGTTLLYFILFYFTVHIQKAKSTDVLKKRSN
jgi:hypothetical protein